MAGGSKLRKAIGAVKDQTSIGLAKVTNTASLSDIDIAIVKATRHDEYPAEEKHIREILSLTSYSRTHINACVAMLSRRLSKTRNWTVALKTLILIHRLLTEGEASCELEVFFATRRGTRMLNMSDFRDTSRADAWDFSAFVRTYARYLDERLEYRMHGRRTRKGSRVNFEDGEEEEIREEKLGSPSSSSPQEVATTPVSEMTTEKLFVRTQHLMQLLDRFLACRPTGAAKNHRIVAMALYAVVRESHQIYFDLQELIAIYVDRFMELQVPDCVRIYEIFCRLSKQFDELDLFYYWCRTAGISRPSELPEIDKLTQQKLDVMDDFIRDKSVLSQSKKIKSLEELTYEEDEANAKEAAAKTESISIEALPAPEISQQEVQEEKEEKEEVREIVPVNHNIHVEPEEDLLNLREDSVTADDHGDKLALALFDGNTSTSDVSGWDMFVDDDTADWETALVQSASNLSGQKLSLAGGFDMLLLDGMYSQPRPGVDCGGTGSASSVALPKAAVPVLALPGPPQMAGGGGDPFAASLAVPPPSFVQMSDMERKQCLLAEEQAMWQQYARDGMQGQLSNIAKLHQAGNHQHHHMGGGGYMQGF